MDTSSAALSADATVLLAEYYHYADLAEHVRALPEAVAVLGKPRATAERDDILADLEAQILTRLEQLDALGLYPTTTTAVDAPRRGIAADGSGPGQVTSHFGASVNPRMGSPSAEVHPRDIRGVEPVVRRVRARARPRHPAAHDADG